MFEAVDAINERQKLALFDALVAIAGPRLTGKKSRSGASRSSRARTTSARPRRSR